MKTVFDVLFGCWKIYIYILLNAAWIKS